MIKTFFKLQTAFILGFVFFFSCSKTHSDVDSPKTNDAFKVTEAQQWFIKNAQSKQTNSVASRAHSKIGNFTPEWQQAIQKSDSKYEVIEAPLKFDKTPGFSSLSNPNTDQVNGITHLLILKDKESKEIFPALMHVFSSKSLIDKSISYQATGNSFSGYIFFTDLNGEFINGWQYENGKIVRKSKKTEAGTNVAGKALPPDNGGDCQSVVINWYMRTCS